MKYIHLKNTIFIQVNESRKDQRSEDLQGKNKNTFWK